MKCGEFQIVKHLFYNKNLSLSRPFLTFLMEYLIVCLSFSVPTLLEELRNLTTILLAAGHVGLHDLGGNLKWIQLYTYYLKVV